MVAGDLDGWVGPGFCYDYRMSPTGQRETQVLTVDKAFPLRLHWTVVSNDVRAFLAQPNDGSSVSSAFGSLRRALVDAPFGAPGKGASPLGR
jgi:hypothetical protein